MLDTYILAQQAHDEDFIFVLVELYSFVHHHMKPTVTPIIIKYFSGEDYQNSYLTVIWSDFRLFLTASKVASAVSSVSVSTPSGIGACPSIHRLKPFVTFPNIVSSDFSLAMLLVTLFSEGSVSPFSFSM